MMLLSRQQRAIVRRYQQRYACHSLRHALSCILIEADAEMAAEERCEVQYEAEKFINKIPLPCEPVRFRPRP